MVMNMRRIEISDLTGKISATILPEYGGMIVNLRINDKDIFYLNDELVELCPILAGGCPVLFPFSGSIVDDSYTIDGKTYAMPAHGLVKNASFAISQTSKSHIKLYATNSEAQKDANYPYDFRLELDYTVSDAGVTLAATVCNESKVPMPHTFGWHPYFTATDKARFSLQLPMREYISYTTDANVAYVSDGQPNVVDPIDNVYYNRTEGDVITLNPADGYKVTMQMDKAYEVTTVWATPDDFVCVEPWLGVPNAINDGKYLRWVPPGTSEIYSIKMLLEEL